MAVNTFKYNCLRQLHFKGLINLIYVKEFPQAFILLYCIFSYMYYKINLFITTQQKEQRPLTLSVKSTRSEKHV